MATETANLITLKGSTDIVKEFFSYSINSILYQRGIYPPETFKREPKYGLTMLVTTDDSLNAYLNQVLKQMHAWLESGEMRQMVCVVKGVETGATLERWVFDVEAEMEDAPADADENNDGNAAPARRPRQTSSKPEAEIRKEIGAIIRQITASVTFLPMLEEACAFDLLVYADRDAQVPLTWEDSDPHHIAEGERADVKLRSFSTKIHKVDTMVSYRESGDI